MSTLIELEKDNDYTLTPEIVLMATDTNLRQKAGAIKDVFDKLPDNLSLSSEKIIKLVELYWDNLAEAGRIADKIKEDNKLTQFLAAQEFFLYQVLSFALKTKEELTP